MYVEEIRERLFKMQDMKYREFQCSLMPNVDPANVIGVRVPMLRKYAAELSGTDAAEKFIGILPHKYYEENNLHMYLITLIKSAERTIEELKRFLPYVDNWATCDSYGSKALKKSPEQTCTFAMQCLESSHTYTIRYGIGLLMTDFLDDNFSEDILKKVAAIVSDEYYVNMMCAWYMATALAKQHNSAMPYFENHMMSPVVWKMAVRKAIESYRIDDDTKTCLRKL